MKNFSSLFFFLFCLTANGQTLEQIIEKGALKNDFVGISVIDNDQEIMSVNGNKSFTPASTLKVVTSWLTLDAYGRDYRFETKLAYRGTIDDSGTLIGDLMIIGGGDPTLGSDRNNPNGVTKEWISNIKTELTNIGIRCIQGDLIIDDSFFQGENVSPQWPYEDLGNYYGSGAWATNINENKIFISFEPTSRENILTKVSKISPNLPQVTFKNEVKTNKVGGRDEAYVFGSPFQNNRIIRGIIPVVNKEFTIKGSLPNPPYNLAQMIIHQLPKVFPQNKILVTKSPIDDVKVIKTYYSLPLIDLAKACNYRSINIYADAFLRLLGKKKCSSGSMKCGLEYIKEKLDVHLFDGSGLAPSNQISPHILANFVAKGSFEFVTTLPQVAKEGTVKYLLRKSPIAPHFKLKSGSVEGVLTYAGILKKNGKSYGIAVMVNHSRLPYSKLKKEVESLLKEIYNRI